MAVARHAVLHHYATVPADTHVLVSLEPGAQRHLRGVVVDGDFGQQLTQELWMHLGWRLLSKKLLVWTERDELIHSIFPVPAGVTPHSAAQCHSTVTSIVGAKALPDTGGAAASFGLD